MRTCSDYNNAMMLKNAVVNCTSSTIHVSWEPLVAGWVRLNFDGAVKGANRVVGSGGVLRDASG